MKALTKKEHDILDLIATYGDLDAANAKQWVLDQIVRLILEDRKHYEDWVKALCQYRDAKGKPLYEWSEGTL